LKGILLFYKFVKICCKLWFSFKRLNWTFFLIDSSNSILLKFLSIKYLNRVFPILPNGILNTQYPLLRFQT